MKYAVEIASCGMICVPNFTRTDAGVQAILRLCLRNLKGGNTGITNGRGRAIAQAVSRRLPTTAVRVQTRV
jgi:hypothetical protein